MERQNNRYVGDTLPPMMDESFYLQGVGSSLPRVDKDECSSVDSFSEEGEKKVTRVETLSSRNLSQIHVDASDNPDNSRATPQEETPEEPQTYLDIIWNKLCEFYGSVLEWISYYMPAYFTQPAPESETPSAFRSNSVFSSHSLGDDVILGTDDMKDNLYY
jgi:hypothetical protein|tara:strand:+ start:167362 stop:167844 length:483 start_codon:yes stop_codon:yes gene_type:complete